MNTRTVLTWLGLSALTAALAAGPTPATPATPTNPARPAARPAPAARAPGPRLQPKIGAAPKAEFQTGGHTYKTEANQLGVAAVRSMPPKSYEPATRNRTVSSFYKEQLAKDAPAKEKLDRLNVGPFRHEYVWWAWHHWELRDRAWWAWNNYAYFDSALWQEWMADQDFKQMITQFDASHKSRRLGLIPDAYAGQPVEVVYNDDYIDAVYNPTPTPPSILVDSTAGVQLTNLLEGSPRLFGKKTVSIGTLHDRVRRYQFISLPANFDPTYDIDVKRDGDLYVFGPSITPKNEAFGAEAGKWLPVSNLVLGQGIDIVYQRQVKAGEKIHLHGMEWSIASEQIELFSPAAPEAMAAARHVVRDLEQMTNNKGDFLESNPSLVDYVQEAHDVATKLITANHNLNDDAVADCHYEVGHLQKMAEADCAQTSDPHLASAGKDFINRVKSLQESLNEVDGLPDPALPAPKIVEDAPAKDSPTDQIQKDFASLKDQCQDFIQGRNGLKKHPRFGKEMQKAATDLAGGLSSESARQTFLEDMRQAKLHLDEFQNSGVQSEANSKRAGELAPMVDTLLGELKNLQAG